MQVHLGFWLKCQTPVARAKRWLHANSWRHSSLRLWSARLVWRGGGVRILKICWVGALIGLRTGSAVKEEHDVLAVGCCCQATSRDLATDD